MKPAREIARAVRNRIGVTDARYQLSYSIKGYAIIHADSLEAAQELAANPERVVGTYDSSATVAQIEADLIAAGCPA